MYNSIRKYICIIVFVSTINTVVRTSLKIFLNTVIYNILKFCLLVTIQYLYFLEILF